MHTRSPSVGEYVAVVDTATIATHAADTTATSTIITNNAEFSNMESAAAAATILATTMTTAVTAAAAATIREESLSAAIAAAQTTTAVIPFLSSVISAQPFRMVLSKLETVRLDDDNIPASLENVQLLQKSLEALYSGLIHVGSSPGFCAGDNSSGFAASLFHTWKPSSTRYRYEIFDYNAVPAKTAEGRALPLPSIFFVVRCLEMFEKVLKERLAWSKSTSENAATEFCDCISLWHTKHKAVTLLLFNQVLEQLMIEEATEFLNGRYLGNDEEWSKLYLTMGLDGTNVLVKTPPPVYIPNQRLKLVTSRDGYVRTLVTYALAARSKVQIMTCYLFSNDPAVRYILLDLLPYIARRNSELKIQILVDLMTIEAAMIKSLFHAGPPVSQKKKHNGKTKPASEDVSTSFVEILPKGAPVPSKWSQQDLQGLTPFEFMQLVIDTASGYGDQYEVKFWCARDSIAQYRIKNHAKCFVVDGHAAIMGGSNFAPTVAAALNELDMLVTGPTAQETGKTFNLLWKSMGFADTSGSTGTCVDDTRREEKKCDTVGDDDDYCSPSLKKALEEEEWTTVSGSVSLIRSEPSSDGDDLILRHILHHLSRAKTSIRVSMGHANISDAVARVLQKVSEERSGIRIQLLFNTWHSCDLRGGQKDLLVSIQRLLEIAPSVEVYVTKTPSVDSREELDSPQPPFLHAKYVVIDSEWSAVGSWNMWTRSAFHEIEHEALVYDKTLALELEKKFDTERSAYTVCLQSTEDCKKFCPSGCYICRGFGPFYCDTTTS